MPDCITDSPMSYDSRALAAIDHETVRELAVAYYQGGPDVVRGIFLEKTAAAVGRLYSKRREPGDEIAFNATLALLRSPVVLPDVVRLAQDYADRHETEVALLARGDLAVVDRHLVRVCGKGAA